MNERTENSFHETLQAFESIWRQKSLPTDARLYICGAVNEAGVRQGDEVYPREITEKILKGGGRDLDQSELMNMVESVHQFVIEDKKLRPQYLTVILHQLVNYLNRNHQHLAEEFERKLSDAASQN